MTTRREFLALMAATAVMPVRLPIEQADRRAPAQRVLVIGAGWPGSARPRPN
jgi:hypothetical protein